MALRWLRESEAPSRVAAVGEGLIELTSAGPGLLRQAYGGDTLNTAIYLARCLSDTNTKVDYVSALGCDALSERLLSAWTQEGLDVQHVARIGGRHPGVYQVIVDETGERSFLYWRNQSAARLLLHDQTHEQWSMQFARHHLLFFSGISLAILDAAARTRFLTAVNLLRRQGVIIAFDSNYRPALWEDVAVARSAISAALCAVDVALVSQDDEHALWGDASCEATRARIRAAGVQEVLVKNGAAPCLLDDGDVVGSIAVKRIDKPTDTTAAGDAFNAGYLACRLRGGSAFDAVQSGQALAAAVIQYPGAIAPREATAAAWACTGARASRGRA